METEADNYQDYDNYEDYDEKPCSICAVPGKLNLYTDVAEIVSLWPQPSLVC